MFKKTIRLCLSDIVRHVGVSKRRQLNYIAKKELGKGPAKILEEVRLNKALRLLKETDKTVNQIADETGFGSALRLQRAFKKSYGVAAGQYRNNFNN